MARSLSLVGVVSGLALCPAPRLTLWLTLTLVVAILASYLLVGLLGVRALASHGDHGDRPHLLPRRALLLPDTSTLLTHTLDWYHGGLLSLLLFTSAGVVAWTLLALYTTLLAHLLVHPLLEAL